MAFNIDDWYKDLTKNQTLFEFKGTITSDLITKVLEDCESKTLAITDQTKLIRRVYNVLVETLQNLYHHSIHNAVDTKAKTEQKYASFVLYYESGEFHLVTGNYLFKDRVKIIKDRIDQINSLSMDEVKALYKMILNNQEFSEKGGGGLGMIDITKRTKNRLKYKFFEVNEEFSFFQLNILIT
jgi:coenzyme F420-reducing hydrogenase delta subunit